MTRMAKDAFSKFGFLSSASDELINLMRSVATRRVLHTGDVLFEQGDFGDALYAIVSGELEVSILSAEGQKLSLNILQKGALAGEIALFSPGPRTATLTAREPTEVWGLSNVKFLAALQDTPALFTDMMELAGHRMRWMADQYADRVFRNVTSRLARIILHLAGPENEALQMSHADLASFIGATRETVSKTLSVWKRNGIIELSRGMVQVRDPEALRSIEENEGI